MIIAEIIPITSSILAESLSYFSAVPINPGTVVTIPLRKKNIRGIVLSTTDAKNLKQNLRKQTFKIRNIIEIHNETIFSPAYLKTIQQLKNYYLVNTGKLINITYPTYITKNFQDFCYTDKATQHRHQNKNLAITVKLLQKPYTERILAYTEIINKNILEEKSTHIICPTVLDVKKIYVDLKSHFPDQVFELHGKTTPKKLLATYKHTQTHAPVIVSTASFIDIPAYNKSTLVLEKDSSEYYYRAVAPHVDMRLLIEGYAHNKSIELIVADSVLRPLRFIHEKNIQLPSPFDAEKINIINAHTKNPKKQTDAERIADLSEKKGFSPLSKKLKTEIQKSITNNESIFCYVQKKSLAPVMSCRDCGNIATDPKTDTPYSMYAKTDATTGARKKIFMNNKTGEYIDAFDVCQFCGGWRMTALGIGTANVADALRAEYPDIQVEIIDSFHTKNKTSIKKVLKKMNEKNNIPKILVGTQLALPYLSDIDSSYVVSIDSLFAQMSYTSNMRALTLIANIYESTKNRLWIQSRNVLNTQLPEIKNMDYREFIHRELALAKDFAIHPYGTVIKLSHICKKTDSHKTYTLYQNILCDYKPDIRIRPHTKKDFQEVQVLLHLDKDQWNMNYQNADLSSRLPFGERNISIQINPEVF